MLRPTAVEDSQQKPIVYCALAKPLSRNFEARLCTALYTPATRA
jgi:hypothetical protein